MAKDYLFKLIEACANNGVSNIEFEGFKISFGQKPLQEYQPYPTHSPAPKFHKSFEGSLGVSDAFDEETREQEKEDFYNTLMISDPAKYEELLAQERLDQLLEE